VRRNSTAYSRIRAFLAVLGPGVIAASAGNDAGGVTTYSQAGAQYGFGLLWVLFFLTFSLAIAQEMGARMAAVTGKGLADLIREEFGVRTALFAMVALVIANVATTVSEFAGITAVLEMFFRPDIKYFAVPVIAGVIWLLVAQGSYRRVERVFLTMCLVYLTYGVAAFIAKPDWGEVLTRTVIPSSQTLTLGYLVMVIALIGTTIAPWMQFYVQSSVRDKGITAEEYPLEKIDVIGGSVLSNAISFFIIVTCAVTLYPSVIGSASEAAQALNFAGSGAARILFAIGLLNASLVGAVVVPLSTAYAVTESLGWEGGLGRRVREAPLFIGVYTAVIVVAALVILFSRVPPLGIILASQVINGILLPVVLVLMLILVNKRRLMGDYVNSMTYNVFAGATVVVVAALSIGYLVVSLRGG